jgi:hypothetical protein
MFLGGTNMKKLFLAFTLFMLGAISSSAQVTPPSGQITAATTNATCVGGVQNGGAVDLTINPATGTVGISVTGTWAATLNIVLSTDHGKTWTASGGTFTANQQSTIGVAGNSDVCVFASAFTSGTAQVTFTQSSASAGSSGTATVTGGAANGSPTSGNPVLIAGQNGGNVKTVTVDASGNFLVESSTVGLTPAAAEASAIVQVNPWTSNSGGGVAMPVMVFGVDPCQAPGVPKSHAFATITTATTTALVAVSGATVVYVCEVDFGITGTTTAGTVLFEQGTGVACATSPVSLTATYTDAGSSIADIFTRIGSGSATAFKTAASNGLCAVTTVGTAPSIPVDVTYVQQ